MPKATAQHTTTLHNLPLPALVDELGSVKAQIPELEVREKSLRDELIGRGWAAVDGSLYSATITEGCAGRWTPKPFAPRWAMRGGTRVAGKLSSRRLRSTSKR